MGAPFSDTKELTPAEIQYKLRYLFGIYLTKSELNALVLEFDRDNDGEGVVSWLAGWLDGWMDGWMDMEAQSADPNACSSLFHRGVLFTRRSKNEKFLFVLPFMDVHV